jgi:hypothetical protein
MNCSIMPGHKRASVPARLGVSAAAGVAAVMWIMASAAWLVIPKFQEIFTEFGVVLPASASAILGFSRWLWGQNPGQSMPGLVFVAMPWLALLIIPAWLGISGRVRGLAIAWLLALAIGCLLLLLILVGAMFSPIVSLIESLQQANP